jgi:hypothetical protein
MDEARNGAVSIFAERVISLARHAYEFPCGGYDSFAECLQRVVRIQETHVIGGDSSWEQSSSHGQAVAFFDRQIQHAFELFEGADAMSGLPAPVIPVIICGVREKAGSEKCRSLVFPGFFGHTAGVC